MSHRIRLGLEIGAGRKGTVFHWEYYLYNQESKPIVNNID
jgi:hypothetical protein